MLVADVASLLGVVKVVIIEEVAVASPEAKDAVVEQSITIEVKGAIEEAEKEGGLVVNIAAAAVPVERRVVKYKIQEEIKAVKM